MVIHGGYLLTGIPEKMHIKKPLKRLSKRGGIDYYKKNYFNMSFSCYDHDISVMQIKQY